MHGFKERKIRIDINCIDREAEERIDGLKNREIKIWLYR